MSVMSKKYNTEERRSMILKALHENHKVLIPDLVETFGVSDVSIRKELSEYPTYPSGKISPFSRKDSSSCV